MSSVRLPPSERCAAQVVSRTARSRTFLRRAALSSHQSNAPRANTDHARLRQFPPDGGHLGPDLTECGGRRCHHEVVSSSICQVIVIRNVSMVASQFRQLLKLRFGVLDAPELLRSLIDQLSPRFWGEIGGAPVAESRGPGDRRFRGTAVNSRTAFDWASFKVPASGLTCSSQRKACSTADRMAFAAVFLSSVRPAIASKISQFVPSRVAARVPALFRHSPMADSLVATSAEARAPTTAPSADRWSFSRICKVAVAVFSRSESASGRPSFSKRSRSFWQ